MRERRLAARERELLATSYFQVVFTESHDLNLLALDDQRLFQDRLAKTADPCAILCMADLYPGGL